MERKEYKKPYSECMELACSTLLEGSTMEVSSGKGDTTKPVLSQRGWWDDEED